MKCKMLWVIALCLTTTIAYAGNGDLIVDGKLGVGTTGPNNKLSVNGNADFGETSYAYAGPSQYGAFTFPRGQILFSNTNSQNQLYLASNAYLNSGGVFAYRNTGTALAVGLDNGAISFLTADNGLADATIPWTNAMSITGGGNVGIGTATPVPHDSLGAHATMQIGNYVTLQDVVGTQALFGRNVYFDGTWKYVNSDYATAIRMNNDFGDGSIGFYLAPYGSAGGAVSNWDGSDIKMVIRNSGNVGIGTAYPAYTLDVSGTIRANNVSPSDIRFKENVVSVESALDKVLNLQGVAFNWKRAEYKDKNFPEGKHYGVIAQEIEKVLPEVVTTGADSTKSVAYTEIIPVLIEAIKEQQKLIEQQAAELKEIRALVGSR